MFGQIRGWIGREHVLRFAFSLVLATLLWGWVTEQRDPIETRRFGEIPIDVPPLPGTLQVVNELEPVTVEIQGPRSITDEVERAEVSATLDMSGISESGVYRVPVEADVPNDVRDVSVNPREVQVQVEATASRNFPLEIERPSNTEDPRSVRAVTPEVSSVTVSGPESAVARVSRVVLPIDLAQRTTDFTASFEPYATDAQGRRISEVEVLPRTVSAFVEVQTRGKSVSVVPQTQGTPAEGFSVVQRTVMPPTVVVDGPPETLNELLFVETQPIDISGSTESIVERVGLQGLSSGVTVVDPPGGMVEMTVVIQEVGIAQELTDQPIEFVGLSEGLTARSEPETITVSLDAPRDLLRTMSTDDVGVRIDLSGRGPGVYEIEPDVLVPPGVTWLGSEPQTVRVVIESQATPSGGVATPGER